MVLVLAVAGVAFAKDKKVKPEELPVAVQQFVKDNFPKATIVSASQESDDKDYNVTLSSQMTLEFGKDNQWSEICTKKEAIPSNLLPKEIVAYVQKTYPKTTITSIERSSQGYEIGLSSKKTFQLSKDFKPTKFKEAD